MKNKRILDIYSRLLKNKTVNICELAEKYKVSERSIQRDIRDVKDYCLEHDEDGIVEYKNEVSNYILKNSENKLFTNSEIIAMCKILLDSRAFLKDEMSDLIDKIIGHCVPKENYPKIKEIIKNEKFHYMELNNKRSFINNIWEIGEAVRNHFKLRIDYKRLDGEIVERTILPVGIMFSEYYFYLLAHIDGIDKEKYFENKDDIFPTIYRFDRIESYEVLEEHFPIPYKDRFEEGEFRKRIQFMTGGKLRKIKFKYNGCSLEAVLDKIPTATVWREVEDGYIISAEVFGKGIDRWILSQGKDVEVL